MTEVCSECRALMAVTVDQRYLGKRCCRTGTIACVKRQNANLRRELAEARAIGELERNALERSVQARQAELRLREHHPDNKIQSEHWRRRDMVDVAETIRSHAVDALVKARAATGEPKEADRG